MSGQDRSLTVAWAGWQVRVPADWRPLTVAGGWVRGAMMLGDARRPMVQVKWWRPGKARFQADRWIARRLRKAAGRSARAESAGPAPDFPAAASVTGPTGRRLWCGYAPQADLALELVMSTQAPAARWLDRQLLPSLRACRADDPTRWAVFDAGFLAPPGLIYRRSLLNLGDVALLLAAGGRRLLLRQVYPATLALSRRGLEKWLNHPPFPERRRFRAFDGPRKWTVSSFGRTLTGIFRAGIKALPVPLGFIRPRSSVAAAVVDERLDRLLLAEYDAPGQAPERALAEALAGMNWARFEREDRP